MVAPISGENSLDRLFAALTEHTFQTDLGIADPPLIDYLTKLLLRFLRTDAMYRVRDVEGNCLCEVVDMLAEAESRQAKPQREAFRHIGDFTLFWSGLYPEIAEARRNRSRLDRFLDYREAGKQAYAEAAEIAPSTERAVDGAVLHRLSCEFELCVEGLQTLKSEMGTE